MKEPQLEEEALRATASNDRLHLERQTMADEVHPLILTDPQGQSRSIPLKQEKPGLWSADLSPATTGLYRVTDGELLAFANLGPANPREFQAVISTPERIQALALATGGSARRIAHHKTDPPTIPSITFRSGDTRWSGSDFIAFKDTGSSRLLGMKRWPIFSGLVGFLLLGTGLLAVWLSEGWLFRRQRSA
jgi:hypothetical protein